MNDKYFKEHAARVRAIASGESPVSDVPSETVRWLVQEEMLTATDDFEALKSLDCVVICRSCNK